MVESPGALGISISQKLTSMFPTAIYTASEVISFVKCQLFFKVKTITWSLKAS